MEKRKILLVIPAYNEEENIERVAEELKENASDYDFIVVNDGSEDRTGELCERKEYNVINLPINLGIGGAVQTGYQYALRHEYDMAIQIDGDGQHDIGQVSKLIFPLLNDEADVVIGSRFLEGEGFQSSPFRRMGIRILSGLILLCTGEKVRDVTSGFRAVNRKFISIYARDYPSDYPEPEAIITAVMHHGRVMEVPVIMREREKGKSSIGFMGSIYYMIKVTLAILVKRISYGIRR